MNNLTKEYFDQKLKPLATKGEIRTINGRINSLDEKIDDLARITAKGFEELRRELDVRKIVEKHDRDIQAIKEALHITE